MGKGGYSLPENCQPETDKEVIKPESSEKDKIFETFCATDVMLQKIFREHFQYLNLIGRLIFASFSSVSYFFTPM